MLNTNDKSKIATDCIKFYLSSVFNQSRSASSIRLNMNDKCDFVDIDVLDEKNRSIYLKKPGAPLKFTDEQLGFNEMLFSVMTTEEISAFVDGSTFYRDGLLTSRPIETPLSITLFS